jgi:hypothetical protein
MARFVVWFSLLCAACSAPQPASLRSVAAVEVPLPSAADKTAFLDLLSEEAMVYGYHVDQESQDDLRELSEVSPFTLNASRKSGQAAGARRPNVQRSPSGGLRTFASGRNS